MNIAEKIVEDMHGMAWHVIAFRAVLVAMLAERPVDEARVLALLEPLLPVDDQGHVRFRQEASGVVSDMLTAAQMLASSGTSRPN